MSKSDKRFFLSTLKVWVFLAMAVPKLSILSENSYLITSETIIDGGGLLLNFFLKWLPTKVLPTITIVIIKIKIVIINVILVFFLIY